MNDIGSLYEKYLASPSIQTDTRKLRPGDIYWSLRGANFDGNDFAADALQKGAAFVVTDRPTETPAEKTIRVADGLSALQALAKHHRKTLGIPVIAITGSNGKTTTKELTGAVLSSHFKTAVTKGNLNNHIGVPLTLLSIAKDDEIAVVEMGANHQGEIAAYCEIALPDHGVITNIGKAHLEGFGGQEGVKKGKGELYTFLQQQKGKIFLHTDDAMLCEMASNPDRIIGYGQKQGLVTGSPHGNGPFLTATVETPAGKMEIASQLVGGYNFPNLLCAAAVGTWFGVPLNKIRSALEAYRPGNGRSQWESMAGMNVVLDAYNANPTSMKTAIENFAAIGAGKKILLLGSMAELGPESEREHIALVDLINSYPWDHVGLVGSGFNGIDHKYESFTDAKSAGVWLKSIAKEGAYLLLKGSRASQMEKAIDSLNDRP